MSVTILVGDVLDKLASLEDESVHCVVTSPPYWGLRDYGVEGQIGLEPTVEEYVEKMTAVFHEVRRVLRKDGTLWLNMGDCYAAGKMRDDQVCKAGGKRNANTQSKLRKASYRRDRRPREDDPKKCVPGLKPKDLVGQPWRLAFALQADGWWLRSDIIWHKPNPMPEAVRDRATKSHEYVFMLTKAARYFWDEVAVREKAEYGRRAHTEEWRSGVANKDGHRSGGGSVTGADPSTGRNSRSVWTIPTQPFPEAHFATFPEELPRRCIAAGTSEKGCCPKCGAPWVRVVEKTRTFESGSGKSGRDPSGKNGPALQGGGETRDVRRGPCVSSKTTGWRCSCDCVKQKQPLRVVHETTDVKSGGSVWTVSDTPAVPCTVLDPFSGAGTTGLVAVRMGRSYIGIELNAEYAKMSEDRIYKAAPLLIGD